MEYLAQQYLAVSSLGCTGTNPCMTVLVFVSTVLRSSLVEIHWPLISGTVRLGIGGLF